MRWRDPPVVPHCSRVITEWKDVIARCTEPKKKKTIVAVTPSSSVLTITIVPFDY